MAVTDLFNVNFTNSYTGDALSELIRVYNKHAHTVATSTNFLATSLNLTTSVGFVGVSAGTADPFAALTNIAPLTIVGITKTTLTLSRAATTSTLGSLTFVDSISNVYTTIVGLVATANSPNLVFDLTVDRSGFIRSGFIERALVRYITTDTQIKSLALVTSPTVAATNALTVDIDTNGFYHVSSYSAPNPTINLVRGFTYTFTSTAAVGVAGGFNIVRDLQNPSLGLKLYTEHLTVASSGNVSLITFSVGYDAPSLLFYQSGTAPYIYGQINITGGTNLPSLTVQQSWQATAPTIPLDPPTQIAIVSLSSVTPYRITKWETYPHWALPNASRDVFLQLQYTSDGINRQPLSPLIELNSTSTSIVESLLIPTIIPLEATVYCAVYSPFNLERLTQQLTLVDLI